MIVIRPGHSTSTYGLDNERLSIKDANSNTTTYSYDGFNRTNITTFPDGSTDVIPLTTGYDKDSNVLLHTNRAGQQETFTYDALDRMTQKVMSAVTNVNPLVTTTWTYNQNGSVAELADYLNGSTTKNNDLVYGYDTAGRMTSVSTAIPGITGSQVTGYVLDLNGNRTQLTWPDGYFVSYAYDSLNRMSTAKESNTTLLATYSYDPLSRRTNLALPNSTNAAYSYSPAGDLLTLNHTITGTGSVPHYTLGYTAAHDLASEASTVSNYNWQPATNGTDAYATANNLNQYRAWTPVGGSAQTFGYDLNGNMTGATIGSATWSYAYDPENHLINAKETSGGTINATYGYDPMGRRVTRTGSGGVVTTSFLDDGQDEIAEYNAAGSMNWRYIPGPAINESIGSVAVSTNVHRYYQIDHHGSLISVVTNGNQVEGPFSYDAYGNSQASSTTPYRYVGMRLDAETGLYYDRARYYSRALGRFLQTDPVGYSTDLNLYLYGSNDPIDKIDPSGRCLEDLCIGEAIVLAGACASNPACATLVAVSVVVIVNTISNNNNNAGSKGQSSGSPAAGAPDEKPAATNDGQNKSKAPPANGGTTASPHGGPEHDDEVNKEIKKMKDNGYRDVRKNQAQVDSEGNKVGDNRPDAQGTNPQSGVREHVEVDTNESRGVQHEKTIKKNDPNSVCTRITLCSNSKPK